jgi:type II secretory pathway component PulF
MHSNGPAVVFCALALAGACVVRILADAECDRWVAGRLWRITAVGERHADLSACRACFATVAMLLKGGIPVVSALGMVRSLPASRI